MIICFSSGNKIEIELCNNPVTDLYLSMLKYLKHIDVPSNYKDNPYLWNNETFALQICQLGNKFSLDVDSTQLGNQLYINYLHEKYEKNYNGDPDWLKFHEVLHLAEGINHGRYTKLNFFIDYRETAGPLIKKFKDEYRKFMVTDLIEGYCYAEWAELGKIPYRYWEDNEPNNLDRFCELSKPWINMGWNLRIPGVSQSVLPPPDKIIQFEEWFKQYKPAWQQHWNVENWNVFEMHGQIPIGKIRDFELFKQLMESKDTIKRILPK